MSSGDTLLRDSAPIPTHERVRVGVLLLLFAALSIHSLSKSSPTLYEPIHLASGLDAIKTGDFRLDADQPALPKLLAGASAAASGVRLPERDASWNPLALRDAWDFARQVLYDGGVGWRRVLLMGRLPGVIAGVLLGLLLWRWTRAMAGPAAATVALFLFTFCPNFLAHAPLVTADVPMALCAVAIAASLWQARRTGSARWIAAASACVAVSLVTKFAAFAFVPAWLVLAGWPSPRRTARTSATHAMLLAALSFLFTEVMVFACYGGAFEWTTARMTTTGAAPLAQGTWIGREGLARIPWPSADYARGLGVAMARSAAAVPVYLLGNVVERSPWWWPFATLSFKLSLPLLLLTIVGVVHLIRRRADRTADLVFVLVPMAAVLVASAGAHTGLGVRRLLPLLSFLMIFAAWSLRSGLPTSRLARVLAIALLVWHAAGALAAHPHYLPFFNEVARAAGGGEKLLGESDLDWGQDLAAAAASLEQRGVTQAILGYFGAANPFVEKLEWQALPPMLRPKSEAPWIVLPAEGEQWLVLSTTFRQGVYDRAPDGGPPYAFLDETPPVERIGHGSIGIWEISRNEAAQRGLADIYLRNGLLDEADAALRRALARIPYDADSRRKLVALWRERGELARADSVIVAGPSPDVAMLLEWISIRKEVGDSERTHAAFETSLLGFPNDPTLKNAYAMWLAETDQDLDRALELADGAIAWDPRTPAFLDTRALIHRKRGNADAAFADLDRALGLPGGDAAVFRWHRALALADAGRLDEAREEAQTLAAREDLDDALRIEIEEWLYSAGG